MNEMRVREGGGGLDCGGLKIEYGYKKKRGGKGVFCSMDLFKHFFLVALNPIIFAGEI